MSQPQTWTVPQNISMNRSVIRFNDKYVVITGIHAQPKGHRK
jgi:hypothetical protein